MPVHGWYPTQHDTPRHGVTHVSGGARPFEADVGREDGRDEAAEEGRETLGGVGGGSSVLPTSKPWMLNARTLTVSSMSARRRWTDPMSCCITLIELARIFDERARCRGRGRRSGEVGRGGREAVAVAVVSLV